MLNKKNLWFLTLFSIILVMSIYYISFPTGMDTVSGEVETGNELSVAVNESENITALKVEHNENLESEVTKLTDILNDDSKTSEEKSDAYEALKTLNNKRSQEEAIQKKIKETLNLDCYVEISSASSKVVLSSKEHSYELANRIIKLVNEELKQKTYTTVNFSS